MPTEMRRLKPQYIHIYIYVYWMYWIVFDVFIICYRSLCMCAVRVYWQNKDLAMESWHNVLERPSWRSCAPPAFLLLPRSRKFNSQFSRPDMDAPQVECLETCKHTEHKTKSTLCGIAHCVCVYSMLPTSGHVLDSEKPAQCLLPLCPRWRSASWARAKGWWIYDERLWISLDERFFEVFAHKNHTLQDSPWPTSPSHLAKQSGDETPLWKVTRNRRPLSTTLPWLTGFRMCHVSAVIRCAWRCQRNYKIFTL